VITHTIIDFIIHPAINSLLIVGFHVKRWGKERKRRTIEISGYKYIYSLTISTFTI